MGNELPTIRVKTESGWSRINRSDFDPAIHEEWIDGEEKTVPEAETAEKAVTQPRRGRPPKMRG